MNHKLADKMATLMFWLGAILVLVILGVLIGYILYHGFSSIDINFLTRPPLTTTAGGGIGPQIFNSFYLLFLSMSMTIPIGLLAGIYMAEYAQPGRITEMIRLSIETLTSLPSIVVGLFGLLVFVNMTGWGYSLASGALALTIFNLPMMVRIVEESISSVPNSLRESSLALGATRWQTIWRVVLPAAFPGFVTGTIIISGRVFGEAAALLYTAGMSSPPLSFNELNPASPASPLNPFRPAETLAVHIWKVNSEAMIPDIRRVADGSAAVLVIIVMMFNLSARWLGRIVYKKFTAG